MKQVLIAILSLYCSTYALGQQYDKRWIIGKGDGQANPLLSNFTLVFQDTGLTIVYEDYDFRVRNEANTTLSDQNGELLLYSNGCYIRNRNHQIIQNGEGLNDTQATGTYPLSCPDYGYPSQQGIFALPDPADSNRYIFFHYPFYPSGGLDSTFHTMLYTTADVAANNGAGAVLLKNQVLLEGAFIKPVACRHANGRDWWILLSDNVQPKTYRILLTPEGFQPVQEQSIPGRVSYSWPCGYSFFSPDGAYLIEINCYIGIFKYDFDRCTGELSNMQHIATDPDQTFLYGGAFSPNSRFLYVPINGSQLVQYDLWTPDFTVTGDTVGYWDGYIDTTFGSPALILSIATAPDGKIYSTTNATRYLHVIQQPDSAGLACQFQQRAITLDAIANYEFPYYPNYRLGPLSGSSCDSLGVSKTEERPGARDLRVSPNPGRGLFHVELPVGDGGQLLLYDAVGRLVKNEAISSGLLKTEIHLDTPGTYWIAFRNTGLATIPRLVIVL